MSEQTTLERLRALEAKVLRLQAGEIPSDALTLGTGQGNAVRIQFRQGGRGGGGLNLAQLPAIVYDTETGSAGGTVRIANDGLEAMPVPILSARDQRAADVLLAGASPAVAPGAAAAGSGKLVHVYSYPTAGTNVALSTSWSEYLHFHLLFQGGFASFPSTAAHRISLYASATSDSANVRMYDQTNGATIWTVSGITSSGFYTTTTVANLPSADALFRVDGQSTAGTPDLNIGWRSWWAIV